MSYTRLLVMGCLSVLPIKATAADLPTNPYALDRKLACGAMCVSFLSSYHGGRVSYLDACALCPPGPTGSSIRDVQAALEKLGFHTLLINTDVAALKRLTCPAVLYLNPGNRGGIGHFVSCTGWNAEDELFEVYDPPSTLTRLTEPQMADIYGGVALVVSKSKVAGVSDVLRNDSPPIPWLGVLTLGAGVAIVAYGVGLRWGGGGRAKAVAAAVIAVALVNCEVGCNARTPTSPSGVANGQPGGETDAENTIDLGEVIQGNDLVAEFHVVNRTMQPLKVLRVDKSCACQVVGIDPAKEIPPSATVSVPVRVPTQSMEGRVDRQFTVVTDSADAAHKAIVLTLRATIKSPIRCIPSDVMFGTPQAGQAVNRTVQVITDPPELADRFRDAVSTNPHVTVTPNKSQPGLIRIELTLKENCPQGKVDGEVRLSFDDPVNSSRSIRLQGRVDGPLTIVPAQITATTLDRAGVMKLRISSTSGQPFRVVSATTPAGITVYWDNKKGANPFQMISATAKAGMPLSGAILLTTDLEHASPVSIPLIDDRTESGK